MAFPNNVLLSAKDIRETSSTQKHPLGTRGLASGGRTFYYAKAGETLYRGRPIKTQSNLTQVQNNTTIVRIKSGEAYTTESVTFYIDTSGGVSEAIVANDLAEGYLCIRKYYSSTDLAGEGGSMLRIKSNTAFAASDTTGFYVTVYPEERLNAALNGSETTSLALIPCPYWEVEAYDGSATTAPIVGVTNINVTDTYYFWLQTWGPCLVLTDGATVGERAVPTTTTSTDTTSHYVGDAAATLATTSDMSQKMYTSLNTASVQSPIVGYWMATAASGIHAPLFLQIAP